MEKFECSSCGYVYDPEAGDIESQVEPGVDFYDLDEDWVCPLCGQVKSEFIILDEE